MKHLSIFPLVLLLFVFGCGQKAPMNSTIIIAGQLLNAESGEVELYMEDDLEFFPIAEDGHFHVKLEIDDYQTFQLGTDRRSFPLFLIPGDSIYVTADAKDFYKSFQVSGDRIPENAYFIEKDRFYVNAKMPDLFEKDKDSYFEGKDRFFTKQKERFEQLKQAHDIHPEFLKLEEAYFTFAPIVYDMQYPNYHAFYNGISKEEVDFPMEETKAKLAEIDLGRSDLLKERYYISIIHHLVREKANELISEDSMLQADPEVDEKATFFAMEALLKNPSVKDYFLYQHVKSNLSYKGPIHAKPSIDKFLAEHQSPHLESKLNRDIEKWSPIMPGKEIPDFSFENLAGETVQLSDLKGTLVYIDIWATWCKPCIEEHPYWNQVKEEYRDKAVSFLTISIDENKEAWEKMVKSKNMDGLQWIAENAWKSDLNRYFMVNSIPRFILLDQDGKIIDPTAERPSGNIRETLDQFL